MSASLSAKGNPVPNAHLRSNTYTDQNSFSMALRSLSSEDKVPYVSLRCKPSSRHRRAAVVEKRPARASASR